MADTTVTYGGHTEIVDGDANNLVSGGAGNDKIVVAPSTTGGYGAVYGGAGNDTFIFKAASFGAAQAGAGTDVIVYDFHGAGGWSAGEQDFLAFTGFGAGSTLSLNTSLGVNGVAGDGGAPGTLYYYTLHDTATGNDYTLLIKSINDKAIAAGDYAFY